MAGDSSINNFDKGVLSVTCRRCNHVFNSEDHQPRLLPCLHDVCLDCLCEIVFDEVTVCPECKTAHKTIDNDVTIFIRDPLKMRNMGSDVKACLDVNCDFCDQEPKATHRCFDCRDNLCPECLAFHRKYKKYRDHDIKSLEEASKTIKFLNNPSENCTQPGHGNEMLKFYCIDSNCEKSLCSICVLPHVEDNHKIMKLDSVFDSRRKNMRAIEVDLQHYCESVDGVISVIKNEMDIVDKQSEEAIKSAEGILDNLIAHIAKRKSEIKHWVSIEQEKKKRTLENQGKEFLGRKTLIEDGRLYMKNVLEMCNKTSFLKTEPLIKTQFKSLMDDDNHCLPCVNSTIRFTTYNMLDDFESSLSKICGVISSNAYAPYTQITFSEVVFAGTVFDILVKLFDEHNELIYDEETDVQVCLVDDSGKITRSLYPCKREEPGYLRTAFKVDISGAYHVEIFILGRPFYFHRQNIDVMESALLSEQETVEDNMRDPIPDLVRSQDDMKPISSPRRPLNSSRRRTARCRPPFHFDDSTLHKRCYISKNKSTLSNTITTLSRYQPTLNNKASVFLGVAGSIYFASPCAAYFEVEIKYHILEDLTKNDVICEVIISNDEMADFAISSRHHQNGRSFSAVFCEKCHQVCLECWNYEDFQTHVPLGLVSKKSTLQKLVGVFLDDTNACISVVDTTESDLLVRFDDISFEKPLWPAFSVQPSEKFTVELTLRTGDQIKSVPVHLLPV